MQQLKSSKRKWEKSFEVVISKKSKGLSGLHVTTAAAERNWSEWGRMYTSQRSTLGLDKARQLITMKHYLRPDSDDSEEEEIALGHLA